MNGEGYDFNMCEVGVLRAGQPGIVGEAPLDFLPDDPAIVAQQRGFGRRRLIVGVPPPI